jgi:hypothetical protein
MGSGTDRCTLRYSFLNTSGAKDGKAAKASAMVRMQVQPRTRRVTAQHSAEDQLCVPAVEMTSQWCNSRSKIAEASTSSPNTLPHSLKALLEVNRIEPRS